MGPYKTIQAAFNALLKGFKKQTKRDPNPIEEEMIMEEAKKKITAQGENISTLDTGIMTQASGTKKPIDIPVRKTEPDLDRSFVTEEEMSAFTLDDNAKKLNRAKGMIDELGAKNTRQKLFVADLVEDVGQGIYENVDMGALSPSHQPNE